MPLYNSRKKQTSVALPAPAGNISSWTVDDIRKSDILVFRESATEKINSVVAPNGFQVGLLDQSFLTDLLVTGHITGSGIIYAETGFSGSLTKLVDGTSYLIEGANITITTGSNGAVTIATSTATGTTTNALTIGNGVQLNSGTTFNGSAAVTLSAQAVAGGAITVGASGIAVDINGTGTTAGIATNDEVLIYDLTATALKKVTVANLRGNAGIDIAGLGSSLNESTVVKEDSFAIDDNGTTKKITLDDVSEFLAGAASNGIVSNSAGQFYIAINTLAAGTVVPSSWSIAVDDGSGVSYKESVADFVDIITGTPATSGLNSTSGVMKVDIPSTTNVTAASGDYVLIADADNGYALKRTTVSSIQSLTSFDIAGLGSSLDDSSLAKGDLFAVADINAGNAVKKITVEDVGQYLGSTTGGGISEYGSPGGTLVSDISNLVDAVINVATDHIAFNDVNAGVGGFSNGFTRKESVVDFVAAIRGTTTATGLSSTSGVMNVDITNMGTTTLAGSDEILIYDITASALKKTTVDAIAGKIVPGDGIDLSGTTVSLDLKSSGGLKITSTEVEVDFGTSSSQVAKGSNTIAISAGDGLSSGGSATIGTASSTINLEVTTSDLKGTGLSVTNNNLDLYIAGTGGIAITTGSADSYGTPIRVDGSGLISGVTAGIGLSGGGSAGDISLALDVSELSALGTIAAVTDYVVIQDVTDNSTKKVLISNLPGDLQGVTAGTGLTGGGTSGTVTLNADFDGTTNIVTAAYNGTGITVDTTDDQVLLYDASDQQVKYVSVSQLPSSGGGALGDITSVIAGSGLKTGGTTGAVTLDVNYDGASDSLIKEAYNGTAITVDSTNDYLVLHDATDNRVKYIRPSQVSGNISALNDIANVSVASPSNDQVLTYDTAASNWQAKTINTGTGVAQYVKEATGTTSAGSALVIPSMNFTGKNPTAAEVGVYLNGQLIHSGSTAEVSADAADYRLNGTTGIIFGFDITNNDIITVNYIDTAFSTGKTVLLHTDDTAFSDGRVITAGDGISISVATPRQLIVNNTGLLQRVKVHVVATQGYTTNDVFTVGNSINFSSVSYTDSRIDIYKNGVLLFKDVGFELKDQTNSLNEDQFKLIGSTSFSNTDRITVVLF